MSGNMSEAKTRKPGRNTDRRITIMRKADTAASTRHGIGGRPKGAFAPRAPTLPKLKFMGDES